MGGWRLLLIIAVACAPHAGEPVGVSTGGGAGAATSHEAGAAVHPLTVLPSDFRARYVKVVSLAKSEHALGRFSADVLAADQATADSLRAGTDPAVGAIVVGDHREKGGAQGPIYVMKKEASGWRFFAADETGETIVDEHLGGSARDACASCHAEAPHAGIFLAK